MNTRNASRASPRRVHLLGLLAGHLHPTTSFIARDAPCTHAREPAGLLPDFDAETGRPLNRAAEDLFVAAMGEDEPDYAIATLSHEAATALLESIPTVELANGTHKYVQIELRLHITTPSPAANDRPLAAASSATSTTVLHKRIVRSYKGLKFHADNYRVAMQRILAAVSHSAKLSPGELRGTVVGGGRVQCDHARKTASVYGYSKTFGRVVGCNKRSAGLISTNLDYKVQWSDDGY